MLSISEKNQHTHGTKEEWDELCNYIKDEILQYSKGMKFPKQLALRLQGLAKGVFIANKNIKPQAVYPYDTILYTAKLCKQKLLNYFSQNERKINGESHKIALIMVFIERDINDVCERLRRKEKSQSVLETLQLDNQTGEQAEYQKRSQDNSNVRLEGLW